MEWFTPPPDEMRHTFAFLSRHQSQAREVLQCAFPELWLLSSMVILGQLETSFTGNCRGQREERSDERRGDLDISMEFQTLWAGPEPNWAVAREAHRAVVDICIPWNTLRHKVMHDWTANDFGAPHSPFQATILGSTPQPTWHYTKAYIGCTRLLTKKIISTPGIYVTREKATCSEFVHGNLCAGAAVMEKPASEVWETKLIYTTECRG